MMVGVRPSYNRSHGKNCFIFYFIFFYEEIECAFLPVMRMFHIRNVERNRIYFFGLFQNLIKRNVIYFCFLIYESFDQPGTGEAVYFWPFTRNPFHGLKLEKN